MAMELMATVDVVPAAISPILSATDDHPPSCTQLGDFALIRSRELVSPW